MVNEHLVAVLYCNLCTYRSSKQPPPTMPARMTELAYANIRCVIAQTKGAVFLALVITQVLLELTCKKN